MHDMTIYIPTYRRLDAQYTADRLSPRWKARAFLVAPPEEVQPLRDRGHKVLSCPEKGIGPTRQWIIDQHDVDMFGPLIMMVDDDLRFYKRRGDHPGRFTELLPGDHVAFDSMMDEFLQMMQHTVLGGIRNRAGANQHVDEPFMENVRLHDLLGLNVEVLREEGIRIDRLRFMEDFDITLQLLTRGYRNLCLNTHCKGDRGSNVAGGCSEYRDLEGQAEAARGLKEAFPDFVRLTERPGWNGPMSGTRTDVAVSWKKAYLAGREGRDLLEIPQEPDVDWSSGLVQYV